MSCLSQHSPEAAPSPPPAAATRDHAKEEALRAQAMALFALPMNDLLFQAHGVHRAHFDPNEVQLSTLLSIKTGGCAEDCAYCPQSARFETGVRAEKLMENAPVLEAARRAKESGATRFCMGAAWRSPKARDMEKLTKLVREVKALGLETCGTFGMLDGAQARALAQAGLDYYNHNLDTSEEYYGEIITTRTYEDRLNTLAEVRAAGMHVCCGGIVGMGEKREDRAGLLATLAAMETPPESVPVNLLVQVEGTALDKVAPLEDFEFVRTLAVARILMPSSYVRLSAGRETMPDALQAMCFFAGANSIFYGDTLLTTANPQMERDRALFNRLGLHAKGADEAHKACAA